MQIVVFDDVSYPAIALGLMLVPLDILFLSSYGLNLAETVYNVNVSANRLVAGMCLVLYALAAGTAAALFRASCAEDAAALGALLGTLVFFVFNVTTWAINDAYRWRATWIDVPYGAATWALLFVVAHEAAAA